MYWRQLANIEALGDAVTAALDMGVRLLQEGGKLAFRILKLRADIVAGNRIVERAARGLAGDAPVGHDDDAIGGGQQLRQFRRDDENSLAASRQISHQRDDLRLRADVD